MTSTPAPRILLTGATGFIGGTLLTHLLASASPTLRAATITCLVRGPARAATLTSHYNNDARLRTHLHASLDDAAATAAAAAAHDVVINTALGYHHAFAQALLRGLAARKKETGRDVWLLHTSGTSNLADAPISGAFSSEGRVFDDAVDDVYAYEVAIEAAQPYAQRGTELGVVEAGAALGVRTVVVMSPTIFGRGTGAFNTTSVQVPTYVRGALVRGRGVVVGEGRGVWDHVHVEDLAALYEMLVLEAVERGGQALPAGKEGIIFSANGRHSWMEVAQGVADACAEEGAIAEARVESVGLAEGAKILASYLDEADERMVELGLCSNSRTVSSVARRLGWKPMRGEEAWRRGFWDDVKAVLEKRL